MKPSQRLGDVVAIMAVAMLTSACTPATSDDELHDRLGAGRNEQGRPEEAPAREPAIMVEWAVNAPDDVQPASVADTQLSLPRISVSVADQLRLYLRSEFGTPGSEAPWYHRIRRVAVGLHTATIHTDLTSGDGDGEAGRAICRAISLFPFSSQGRHVTSLDIAVLGQGGRLLASESYEPPRPTARTRPGMPPIHAPKHNPPVFQVAPSPEAPPRSTPIGDR